MTRQFGRKASLVVTAGSQGLDLSQLRFTFKTTQSEVPTPSTCDIRVYNLNDDTSKRVQNEFTRVILQAGYEDGQFGVIFDGTVKQIFRGRENPTDTFLHIFAADGDIPYNNTVVNESLPAGSTPQDHFDLLVGAFSQNGVNVHYAPGVPLSPAYLRGKVLFGLGRDRTREFAENRKWTFSIQGGNLVFIPITGYRPGQAVVLTSKTGLIGMPEQTEGGISARCLLNPLIQPAGLVKIDNRSIIPARLGSPLFADQNHLPRISEDGTYRAMVVEHEGDTRGDPWYTNLTCIAVDITAPPDSSVQEFG